VYKTSFKVSLCVIILMLPWVVAQAAGLGKLTLNSALGQPFSAEIDIVSTGNDDLSSLKASVATREAFAQAGINYESVLSAFKVSIETRANGNPYIKLTSLQAVNDPFLMLLMELNWSSGRILREYTVLLDPVESPAQNLITANTNPPPLVDASGYDAEKSPRIENNNPMTSPAPSTVETSNRSNNTYGPVSRGDTLSSIALQVLPAGVDLNQMLVALYRANREAFIASNMNLLKTGAILKVPEKNEITAIDSSTARTEIKTQIADWRNYRGRLAAINQESPAPHAISQSDQGQITSIDKKSTSAPDAPKEVLKLSSGAQLLDQDGQIAESSLADRLRMMEEDAIARNLALKEANERVAMLEKSVENLKQLLELKDSVLAQAQIKAESIPATINEPESHFPPEGVSIAGNVELDSASGPEEAPVIQPVAEAPVITPSITDEDAGRSWLDQAYDYVEYIGAALILLLLLILLILKRRRNQSQDDEEIEDNEEDFSSAMRSRIASMAAAKAAPVTEEGQSSSENMDHDQSFHHVDSYSQAEEPEKFDKDIDLSYEDSAEHTLQSDFDAESATEPQIDDETILEHSQAIHRNLQEGSDEDLGRPIAATEDKNSVELANQIDFDLSDEADQIATDGKAGLKNARQIKETENVSDYAVEIDFDEPEQSPDAIDSSNKVTEKKKGDFEFSRSEIDLADNQNPSEVEIPLLSEESGRNSEEVALDHNPLEFDRSPDAEQSDEESNFSSITPEIDLAAINLDLEDANADDNKDKTEELNVPSEAWQEVETKLDLAKAYQEMDDREGAKEMLEEVIRDGDTKQKKSARKILKDLR